MQPFDEIKQYSKTVCDQIRWKKAHNIVTEEIENHLCDQRDAYISQGEDEKTATQKAILQMGDAVSIGRELDKIHRPKPQWAMIAFTAMLMLTGMISNYFIDSTGYSLPGLGLVSYIIAFSVFLICYLINFSFLGKYVKECYFVTFAALVLGLLLGTPVGGRIWFSRLSVSFSYLSLILPLVYSLLVYALRHKGYTGIILCGIGYIPFAIILRLVPSSTGFALFTISALVILCLSIVKGWFGIDKKKGLLFAFIPAVITVIADVIHIIRNPDLINRLLIAVNPYSDRSGAGYAYCLIRDLLANSKFAGKGTVPAQFGSNVPVIPAFNTDYILATLTYNFGWITFGGILVVFISFSILGLYHVAKQKSVLGTLVSLSVMLTFDLQVIIYIIFNLGYGILPALSLPFISYGKTDLIINSALIGFMLSIFRTGSIFKDSIKSSFHISYEDGKLTIALKR
ncbi:FtsW/RodA/SpoVE family cell cycle protein [Acetivibrio straminisolvens]|jgi:cell division protein FtsW (lipid II flippase)|uniref:Cell division protein FtsW n=1 Tax=Acetivibrio straminisolvens JCM 21531 TaxID=1294263 RepID=W4V7L7_9FIRM|nr:FtsW/RodA/SpoVE family cell cycle protein [Acetivibrio straminisolvens]GAE88734.1 cell division protein FtsW [Acetivibrio straminisolvens JCM 21531]